MNTSNSTPTNDTSDENLTHARGAQKRLEEVRFHLKYLTANVTSICDGVLGHDESNAYCSLAQISSELLAAEESIDRLIQIEDEWSELRSEKAAANAATAKIEADAATRDVARSKKRARAGRQAVRS